MSGTATIVSTVAHLAQLIEDDMHRKGLAPGAPYLTACEAGQMLGVHSRTADRAMSLLAKRSILIRKRKTGSLVGLGFERQGARQIQNVHVLIRLERLRVGFPVDALLRGLASVLPGCDVQFNLLPQDDGLGHIAEVIENGEKHGNIGGLVLIGCPVTIQEFVLRSRVPAVVFGGVYHSTSGLSSLDRDQFEIGRLEAEYLLEGGHKKIALLCQEIWQPGDNRCVAGMNEVLGRAGLNLGSLIIRSLPTDRAIISQEVCALLSEADRPTGLICRHGLYAEAALDGAKSLGLNVPQDVGIVFGNCSGISSPGASQLPQVCCDLDLEAQAVRVGQMLKECMDGGKSQAAHELIPVKLVRPENSD